MYNSYLCNRTFKDSSEVINIFRVLRRRCWGDIIQVLDAIAYSKQASGKDYHNGWIKIEQSKLASRTNYTRSYISTQILELQAVGLLELKREKFECYCYKFTPLAKEIFRAIARLEDSKFTEIKSLVRDRLRQLAISFAQFTLAPSEQITSFWSQIREKLIGVVHFSTYIQDPLQENITNSLISNEGTTNKNDRDKSADAESLISKDPEPEHLPTLDNIPPSNPLPSKHPDPSEGITPPTPPRTTSHNTDKNIWGNERPIVRQKRQAAAASPYLQGLNNPTRRWKDFEDYQKFEAYATKWAENRRQDPKQNPDGSKYGSDYVSTILSRTANADCENDPNLICWKSWNLEAPPLLEIIKPDFPIIQTSTETLAKWEQYKRDNLDRQQAQDRAAAEKAAELARWGI